MGAKLVEGVEDIIEEFPYHAFGCKPTSSQEAGEAVQADITPDERRLLALLDPIEPRHIDWLIERAHLPTSMVNASLLQLELAGKLTQLPGKLFVKALR
jgi:DNA processing protein